MAKPAGIRIVDARLSQDDDGLYRPDSASPTIGAAEGDYPSIDEDVDGQTRGKEKDVGCDQQSTQHDLRRPLTRRDVGPNWMVGAGS
jgi:poly(beta-D-mannuronate) lyase